MKFLADDSVRSKACTVDGLYHNVPFQSLDLPGSIKTS